MVIGAAWPWGRNKKYNMSHQCHLLKRYIHSFIQMNNRILKKKKQQQKFTSEKQKKALCFCRSTFICLSSNK